MDVRCGGVACALILLAAGGQAAEVRLRSSAVVRSPVVRLADVAEVFAHDPAVVEGLSLIALSPAPAAGAEKSLTQHDVRQMLVTSGVERQSVRITGSDRVTVLADASTLSPRQISREYDSAAAIQQASFTRPADAAASRARPTEPPPADKSASPPPRLVDRGTSVTVYARAAGVRVTTSGKALANGAAGDTVTVELDDSRERVLGRVVAPHTVEVLAGRSIAANQPASVPTMEGDQ